MSAPFTVSAKARDLTFQFEDSCNCCCGSSKATPRPNAHVYVNSRGFVVEFDPRKAEDERESLKRCVANLQQIIGEMAEAHSKDKQEMLREIERNVVQLHPQSPAPITAGMVTRIISLIKTPWA